MVLPDGLTLFTRNVFLLARTGGGGGGQVFQQAVAQLARGRYGFSFVQGPGQIKLLGRRAASGLAHEIDAGIQAPRWVGMLEAKAVATGPTKNDMLIFDGKTFDLYVDRLLARRQGPHYRMLVSAYTIRDGITCFGAQRGIISVSPDLMPLPMLLSVLGSPVADELFSDIEMQEAERLFSQACSPLEEIWHPRGDQLHVRLRRFLPAEAHDLTYLHQSMSRQTIEYLDRVEPDWAESRTYRMANRLSAVAAFLGAA